MDSRSTLGHTPNSLETMRREMKEGGKEEVAETEGSGEREEEEKEGEERGKVGEWRPA